MPKSETVENQKFIIIKKEAVGKGNLYSIINLKAFDNAMLSLKGTDFKLWCYLAKNQDNWSFALSRVDFCRVAGCSKPTYLSAVQSLIDKGYLIQKKDNSNIYIFYEGGSVIETEDDIDIEIPEQKIEQINSFEW